MKTLLKYDEVTVSVMDRILFYIENQKKEGSENVYHEEMMAFDIYFSKMEEEKLGDAITFLWKNNYCEYIEDCDKGDLFYRILPKGEMVNANGGILNFYLELKYQYETLVQSRISTDAALKSAKSSRIAVYVAVSALIVNILFQIFSHIKSLCQ